MGRQAANAVANCLLQLLYLPSLPFGALAPVHGLREAASRTLCYHIQRDLMQLSDACARLTTAADSFREHSAAFSATCANAAEQGWDAAAQPVFNSLPCTCQDEWIQCIASSYANEALVKAAIVEGIHMLVEEACSSSLDAKTATDRHEFIRGQLEVYLTAWGLQAELDEVLLDSHMAMMNDDMHGF